MAHAIGDRQVSTSATFDDSMPQSAAAPQETLTSLGEEALDEDRDEPMGTPISFPAEAGNSSSHDRGMGNLLDSTKGLPNALNKLQIVLSTGDKLSLNCSRLKNGSFQWKFSSGTKRCAKTGHATRGEVLRAWLDDYRPMLAPTSIQDVLDFLKLIEGEATPPLVCPPPPAVMGGSPAVAGSCRRRLESS
eukprot:5670978-Amphidinium_carterae.1